MIFDVGKRLGEVMSDRDLSQYKLSKMTGVGQSTISDIISGKKSPTVETLSKLCDAIGIPLNDFFTDEATILLDMISKIKTHPAKHGMGNEVFVQLQNNNKLKAVKDAYIPAAIANSVENENHKAAWLWSNFDKLSVTDQVLALSSVISEIIFDGDHVIKIIEKHDSELDSAMEKIKQLGPKERKLLFSIIEQLYLYQFDK